MTRSNGRLIVLLIVFPSIHYVLTFRLVRIPSKVTTLDVANSTKLLWYVLIRYLCSMGNITWLNRRLYLIWVDCRPCWHVSVHYGLTTSRHCNLGNSMDRLWITSSCNFDFWVIYYEVVYIIVRYDVSHYFLVLLPSWCLSFYLLLRLIVCCTWSWLRNLALENNLCSIVWVLF